MNMNEKDIDHLTRKLMRGTAEQPSASLNSRIMALIIQVLYQETIYTCRHF